MNNPINYQMAQEQFEFALSRVEYYQDKIVRLINRYGTGVRPSWVSTDLAMDGYHRDQWQKEADRLEQWVLSFEAKQDALAEQEGE